jgi:alpha-tubulin suppressor-like RCC1 family protein
MSYRHAILVAAFFVIACRGSDGIQPQTGVPTVPVAVRVAITAPDSLITGDTAALSAIAYDKNGVAIPGVTFVWVSRDTNVAAVDSAGKLVARSYGPVELVASIKGPGSVLPAGTDPPADSAHVGVRLVLATLSSGGFNNCGVARGGVLHCWGEAAWGRLGTGVAYTPWKSFTAPTAVVSSARFRSEDSDDGQSGGHSCAVALDGAAYCWGYGAWGMLGDGQNGQGGPDYVNPTPSKVGAVPSVKEVALGVTHTCLLANDGTVWCAGSNDLGQLGVAAFTNECTGGTTCVTRFAPVDGGHRFRTITAGTLHNCGLTDTGEAWCWGMDVSGQTPSMPVPERVPGGLLFKSIVSGGYANCGITVGGVAYCWGYNYEGEAGIGSPTYIALANPTAVATPVPLVSLAHGVFHACGLSADGTAYCWGYNEYGQLGGTTTEKCGDPSSGYVPCSSKPVKVNTLLRFTQLGAGYRHTCGLVATGEAYCWGRNDQGQLGTGDTTSKKTPTRVITTR